MRKREGGQVFILVLILLAIGALLAVPALRLTGTALKSSQIVTRQAKALYAADAAEEYVLWKLLYQDYGSEFTYNGEVKNLTPEEYPLLNVYGIPVDVIVIMRAVEGQGGVALATDDAIRPTKTVVPSEVDNNYAGPYTYTIKLDQLSTDTSEGLDAVYDVLPQGLTYIPNSSRLRVDGGEWTDDIGEPDIYITGGRSRLRWPYSGFFETPMRDFAVRQVKEIKFDVTGPLTPNNATFYNWVLLKLGDIDTLSGPTAPIILGDGAKHVGGLLEVSKRSEPEVITPGVETPVKYTIEIKNLSGATQHIQSLTDYLPPGFSYSTNIDPPELPYAVYHPESALPSGITNANPDEITILTREGEEDRYRLYWTFSPAVSIAEYKDEEDILYLTFWARTTQEVSGSYYNEVTVEPDASVDAIFKPPDMSVTDADYNTNYSWTTGAVMVPAYDVRAEAMAVTVEANMSLTLEGVAITSWQVK